jgi:hypothetical protein
LRPSKYLNIPWHFPIFSVLSSLSTICVSVLSSSFMSVEAASLSYLFSFF